MFSDLTPVHLSLQGGIAVELLEISASRASALCDVSIYFIYGQCDGFSLKQWIVNPCNLFQR